MTSNESSIQPSDAAMNARRARRSASCHQASKGLSLAGAVGDAISMKFGILNAEFGIGDANSKFRIPNSELHLIYVNLLPPLSPQSPRAPDPPGFSRPDRPNPAYRHERRSFWPPAARPSRLRPPRSAPSPSARRGRPPRRARGSRRPPCAGTSASRRRSEEHTSELQSRPHLVCRLLLEKKKKIRRLNFLIKKKKKKKKTQ